MNTITQQEIDALPAPPLEWINDIKLREKLFNDIRNIDCKKELDRLAKQFENDDRYGKASRRVCLKNEPFTSYHSTLYGEIYLQEKKPYEQVKAKRQKFIKEKNGIEILGYMPSIHKYIKLKDLRAQCKMNGLKGYSRFGKPQLITLLLSA